MYDQHYNVEHYLDCKYVFKCIKFTMESPALKAIISIICAKIISCENDARCKIKKSRNLFECIAVVLCKLEDMYENCHEEVYLVFFVVNTLL